MVWCFLYCLGLLIIIIGSLNDIPRTFYPQVLGYTNNQGRNKLDVVTYLVNRGVRINTARGSDQSTPVKVACNPGNVDMVTYLMEHGADVNSQDYNGETPRHAVVQNTSRCRKS